MTLKAPYLLALCDASQESDMSFGPATRLGAPNSTFDVQAAKVIHSLVTFSPASESVAIEILNDFEKVSCLNHLVTSVLSGEAGTDVHQWAQDAMGLYAVFISNSCLRCGSPSSTLLPVRNLNPGGKRHLKCPHVLLRMHSRPWPISRN